MITVFVLHEENVYILTTELPKKMCEEWNVAAIHISQNDAPFSGPNCQRHLLVAIAVCTRLLAPKNGCPVPNSKRRLTHNIRNSANHHQVLGLRGQNTNLLPVINEKSVI